MTLKLMSELILEIDSAMMLDRVEDRLRERFDVL